MKYTDEYVATALKLSDEIGVQRASEVLGIHHSTLGRWRLKRKNGKMPACMPIPVGQLLQRIREMEQENVALRQTNLLLIEAINVSAGGQQGNSSAATH